MIKKNLTWLFFGLGMHSLLFAEGGASIEKGRQLYMQNCAACHGKDGRADTPMGKTLKNIPDFTSSAMASKSDQQLFNTITDGHPPMPSFKHLSEQDRMDLVHFVRTFSNGG